MTLEYPLLWSSLIVSVVNAADAASSSGAHKIYSDIFSGYNKNLRPVKDGDLQTLVYMDSGLYSIDEISELKETITITTWLWLRWDDQFIRWDSSQYNNVSEITVPSSLFWVPDIVILGMQEVVAELSRAQTFGSVSANGTVEVAFLQVVKVHCDFDIRLFPFDTQNCTIRYGSWEYSYESIDMDIMKEGFGTSQFQDNTEWELLSYEASLVRTSEADADYVEVHYYLVIRRLPMYYIFALVVPSFVITMLAMVGLFSPFNANGERQEKVTMGLTTLLTMSVLLLIVAEQMPKTSTGLPLVGMYILCEIIVASVATCVTVVTMCLHRQGIAGRPTPSWLLKVVCLKSNKISMSTQWSHDMLTFGRVAWTVDRRVPSALILNSPVSDRGSTGEISLHGGNDKQTKASLECISKQVEVCLAHLEQLMQFVHEKRNEQDLVDLWRKATDRLDMLMMIIFMTINITVSVIMLVVLGFMHQNS